MLTSLPSKLIDVTQTTRADEGRPVSHHPNDYPKLFAEQFGGILAGEGGENEGRPDSDTTLTEQEEVNALRRTLRKEGTELATWKKPKGLGSLSIQFDDLMTVAAR